jgi:hypothetical protein
VSWYTWLEQGRDINVSQSVVEAVSRALLLDQAEREHLYLLAGLNPPRPATNLGPPLAPELRRLLEGGLPRPAFVMEWHWNFVAINEAACAVLGHGEAGHNLLVTFFTNPRYCAGVTSWAERAPGLVAEFVPMQRDNPMTSASNVSPRR